MRSAIKQVWNADKKVKHNREGQVCTMMGISSKKAIAFVSYHQYP